MSQTYTFQVTVSVTLSDPDLAPSEELAREVLEYAVLSDPKYNNETRYDFSIEAVTLSDVSAS